MTDANFLSVGPIGVRWDGEGTRHDGEMARIYETSTGQVYLGDITPETARFLIDAFTKFLEVGKGLKCPECVKAGEKSTVWDEFSYGEPVTAMPWEPHYDGDGQYHTHDPNRGHSNHWQCSNGHEFTTPRKLCKCGWPHEGPNAGAPSSFGVRIE